MWHYVGGRGKAVDRCRRHRNEPVSPLWPACPAFTASVDCLTCGACCREAYHSVEVAPRDPFVRLHQPSAFYGVASRVLGTDSIDETGPNAGFYERATAAEICDYFDKVLDEHHKGRKGHEELLWTLLNLEIWHRTQSPARV